VYIYQPEYPNQQMIIEFVQQFKHVHMQ